MEYAFPGVYYAPTRWPTADGYIPSHLFDLYAAALAPAYALDRLNSAQAIGMALATDPRVGRELWESTAREVYRLEA